MKYFSLIWKNLLRNKRRNFLTVMSVAVLVLLLSVILTIYDAMMEPPKGQGPAMRLWSMHRTALIYNLPESHETKIRQIPGVKATCNVSWFAGVYGTDPKDAKNWFGRLAADTKTFFDCMMELQISPEHKQAFLKDRQGAVAGERLMRTQGWKIGDKIVFKGDMYPVDPELYIRGTFTAEDKRAEDNLWFRRDYLEELLQRPGIAGSILVVCENTDVIPRVAQAVDAMFANSDAPTRTMTEKEFSLSFMEMIGNIKLILFSVSFAILFVMALVTANTVAMSTRERTTEAAVMKTLGFLRSQILGLVLVEASLMSLTGAGVGLLISLAFIKNFGQMGWIMLSGLSPMSISVAVAGAMGVGLISAAVPATRLASLRIVDGLRKVG